MLSIAVPPMSHLSQHIVYFLVHVSHKSDGSVNSVEPFAKLEDVHKSNAARSAVFSFFQIFGRLLSKMTKLFQKSATSGV